MDFQDFPVVLGKSGRVSHPPPKLCAGLERRDEPQEVTTGNLATEIATVNADGSGHLEVTLGGKVHPDLAGVVIRFERSTVGEWRCEIDPSSAPGWHASYAPGNCTVL